MEPVSSTMPDVIAPAGGRRGNDGEFAGRKLHPWPVRIMHWTKAVAMLIVIPSGWGIYDDSVLFGWMVRTMRDTLRFRVAPED